MLQQPGCTCENTAGAPEHLVRKGLVVCLCVRRSAPEGNSASPATPPAKSVTVGNIMPHNRWVPTPDPRCRPPAQRCLHKCQCMHVLAGRTQRQEKQHHPLYP